MNQINPSHKNNYNLLRLIGAILVIVSHSFDLVQSEYLEPIAYFSKDKLECSGVGLTIFFFISGYFVTGSAVMSNSKSEFILKRIRRIYPALIGFVLISVFIAGPLLTILPLNVYYSENDTWQYLYTATGLKIRMNLPGVFSLPNF